MEQDLWMLVYHAFGDDDIEISAYSTFEKLLNAFDDDLHDDMQIYTLSEIERDVDNKKLYYHADGRTCSFEVFGYWTKLY